LSVFDGARARLALLALALVVVLVVAVVWRSARSPESGDDAGTAATAQVGMGGTFDQVAYEGLGTWVDVFDFAPAYQEGGLAPPITPDDMAAMAGLGVKTLYLQAARLDDRSPDGIVDRDLVGRFLEAAHEQGIRVVGWYLPKFAALDADTKRLDLIVDFEWNGHRFDGITVDIEDVENVPDGAERNTRLIELSRRLREKVGPDATIGAGVLPPVQIEVVNLAYWPGFPWKELAPYYDVWLPMAYWSFRNEDSGYKDGYTYVEESVRRLRANLGEPAALVHPIGGIGDAITEGELRDYLRALTDTDALGGSIYDYRTMNGGHWGVLRGTEAALAAPPPPPTTLAPPPTTLVPPVTTAPGATTPPSDTTTVPPATTTAAPADTTALSSAPAVTATP
jgi:hypothetical protein